MSLKVTSDNIYSTHVTVRNVREQTWKPVSQVLRTVNDLSNAVTHNATPILFADDTSILISRPNIHILQNDLTIIFGQITKWFEENSLSLKLGKTHFIQFSSKNQNNLVINITYENGHIPKVNEIKFLGLYINNTLSWSTHIDNILPNYPLHVMP
jgi:hypothetical protein